MKTCEHCQKEFQPKRRHARFCSEKCGAAFWRKNHVWHKKPVKNLRRVSTPLRVAKKATVPAVPTPVSGSPAPFTGHAPISFADLMKKWTTAPDAPGSDAAKATAAAAAVRQAMQGAK